MKYFLKQLFVAVLVLCALQNPAFCLERIEAIYNVTIKGQQYQLVELVAVQRDEINPLNILRGRRGPLYHEYRVYGSNYPVRFYGHDQLEVERQTAGMIIPDHRSFNTKHPYVQPTMTGINWVLSALSCFI